MDIVREEGGGHAFVEEGANDVDVTVFDSFDEWGGARLVCDEDGVCENGGENGERNDEPVASISSGFMSLSRSLTVWRLPSEQALSRTWAMFGWVVDGRRGVWEEAGRRGRDEGKTSDKICSNRSLRKSL